MASVKLLEKIVRCVMFGMLLFMLPTVVMAQDPTETPNGGLPRSDAGQLLLLRNGVISVIDGDGSNERQLIDTQGTSNYADWTPDGSQIIFSQASGLYRAQADGSNITAIIETDEEDSTTILLEVSPDARHSVWVVSVAGAVSFYLVDIVAQSIQTLDEILSLSGFFSWSPDSTQLLFATRASELYLLNVSSSEQHKVGAGHIATWSPDGTMLAIPRNVEDSQTRLDLVRLDGTQEGSLVTFRGLIEALQWSPDGRQIAYAARHYLQQAGESPSSLHVIETESGDNHIVTPTYLRADLRFFEWSPDSQQIVLTYYTIANLPYLYIVYPNDQRVRQILNPGRVLLGGTHWRP